GVVAARSPFRVYEYQPANIHHSHLATLCWRADVFVSEELRKGRESACLETEKTGIATGLLPEPMKSSGFRNLQPAQICSIYAAVKTIFHVAMPVKEHNATATIFSSSVGIDENCHAGVVRSEFFRKCFDASIFPCRKYAKSSTPE